MLSALKKRIAEKEEYLNATAAIFEDGSGMNLDDLIVLKEDADTKPTLGSDSEFDLSNENEPDNDKTEGDNDNDDGEEPDGGSSDETPLELDNDGSGDHDIMDDEIEMDDENKIVSIGDDNEEDHDIMDDEIPEDDEKPMDIPGADNDLPTPVGAQTGLPITGDVDDLLTVDIDLKSNTTKDILPVPPAHAAEALPDDSLENTVDSGFGESTGDPDIDHVCMLYESYCDSCINNGLIPVDQFEFIESVVLTEGLADAMAAKAIKIAEDPRTWDRLEKKAKKFECKVEKHLAKMDKKEQKKAEKKEEKQRKAEDKAAEKEERRRKKLEGRAGDCTKEKIERVKGNIVSDKKQEKLVEKQRRKEERAKEKDRKKKHYMERVKLSLLEAFPDCEELISDEFLEDVIYESIELTGEDNFLEAITLDNGSTVEGNADPQTQQNPAPAPQSAPQPQAQQKPQQPQQQPVANQNTDVQQAAAPATDTPVTLDAATPAPEAPTTEETPVEAPAELQDDGTATLDGTEEQPDELGDDTMTVDGLDGDIGDGMDDEIPEDEENAVTAAVRDKVAEADNGGLDSDVNKEAVKGVMKRFSNLNKSIEDLRNDITDLM